MSSEQNAKRQRTEEKRIGTHSGSFHCDEALAVWFLKQTSEFEDAQVIRTRDEKILSELDIIVDVGGEYDPSRNRFDHHQRGFTETFSPNHSIKLSSAGLIYKHFGQQVIQRILMAQQQPNSSLSATPSHSNEDSACSSQCQKEPISTEKIELIWNKVYDAFVKPLDAIDNGISQYDTENPPRYSISTDLSSRVGNLNPSWFDPSPNPDEQFTKAVALTGSEFLQSLQYYSNDWFLARDIVSASLAQAFGPDNQILELNSSCPWKTHLHELEEEQHIFGRTKFVIFTDQSGMWRIQAVPRHISNFGDRLSLPVSWRGLRDQALSEIVGIPDCTFVHASGFIGGHKTRDGVVKMAELALQDSP